MLHHLHKEGYQRHHIHDKCAPVDVLRSDGLAIWNNLLLAVLARHFCCVEPDPHHCQQNDPCRSKIPIINELRVRNKSQCT